MMAEIIVENLESWAAVAGLILALWHLNKKESPEQRIERLESELKQK